MHDEPTHPQGDAAARDALGSDAIRVSVPDDIDPGDGAPGATAGMRAADAGAVEGPVSDRIAPADDSAAGGPRDLAGDGPDLGAPTAGEATSEAGERG